MRKTTLFLPDDLAAAVEELAKRSGRSMGEVVIDALRDTVAGWRSSRPHVPLAEGVGDPTLAERVDHLLAEFGDD